MSTSKANPATQVCQHTMEALMSANPASGYTKREGDPDKGEQVRHYCTNCWWDVMSHQTTLDVNARQVAEQQAAIIDPAKRAYAAAKRDIETMSFDKNALIQQFEQQVRKGNMSPSQLVWLSPFVFGGLEQREGHYLLSAMASTIATGSDDPMVRAHNVIYARRRNLEHKIDQVMNSRLPIMPTNGFCPDMDELVLAAALPSPVTGGGETRGAYPQEADVAVFSVVARRNSSRHSWRQRYSEIQISESSWRGRKRYGPIGAQHDGPGAERR